MMTCSWLLKINVCLTTAAGIAPQNCFTSALRGHLLSACAMLSELKHPHICKGRKLPPCCLLWWSTVHAACCVLVDWALGKPACVDAPAHPSVLLRGVCLAFSCDPEMPWLLQSIIGLAMQSRTVLILSDTQLWTELSCIQKPCRGNWLSTEDESLLSR